VKLFFRFIWWVLGVVLLLGISVVTTVDWTPKEEMAYYKDTMERLEQLQLRGGDNGYLLAGWAKQNFTPSSPMPLIPYKPRGEYEFIQDSSYIKSLVISNDIHTVALVNYELLFVHPFLARKVEGALHASGLPIDHIYFTTTHTHTGMGGYTPGLVGKLTMGGKDEDFVDFLAYQTVQSLEKAYMERDTVEVSFKKTPAENLVTNRLVPEDPVDPYIRQFYLEKMDGETCLFATFSAHPTILESDYMGLSGDYPYYFTQLAEEELSFSIFAAGTVGSHRPDGTQGRDPASVKAYAEELYEAIRSDLSMPDTTALTSLFSARVEVGLRSPHFRLADNLRLRPWVFERIYGESPAHMDILQIGEVVFLSSSGEVSGVFYENWDKVASSYQLNLLITSFNGGYIGYITPDKYYGERWYETWDMNFFGPYNGAYQHELVLKGLDKVHLHTPNIP
jgi:hypothetical protein